MADPDTKSVQTVRYEIIDERSDLYERTDIDLSALLRVVWLGKMTIFLFTTMTVVAAVAYAIFATEYFRADTVLTPAESSSAQGGLLGQFGALASLGGIELGGANAAEALAVLRSRDFAREFIKDFQLLPVFFSDDWDPETQSWKIDDEEDWPDIRDGIKYFQRNVMNVSEEKATGLVTVSIEWKDPVVAAHWANTLVVRLNASMRQRALAEANANIEFLGGQLEETNLVTLQQAIGRLLEIELQKLMVAKGAEEYVYKVVDSAQVPRRRSWPKRVITVITAFVVGFIISLIFVLVRGGVRRQIS